MSLLSLIPAILGAGSSLLGSSQAKKANKTATTAANAANAANLAANRENRDYIAGLNQPKIQGGNGAFDMLLREFGVSGPAPQGGAQGGARQPGGFAGTSPMEPRGAQGGLDGQAYWDANPDLAADQSLSGFNPGDLTGDGTVDNADRGAWHYQQYGQTEGRNAPQVAPQEQAPEGPAPYDPMTAPPPQFERRADIQMQDYGQAPDSASYFSNFEEDPGAAYRRSEALNGVNAYSAARGKLRSGDGAKALATLASDLGSQEYGNWFNRQSSRLAADRGQFNTNRADSRNMYTFQNNRQDANTGDDYARSAAMWQNRRDYGTGRSDNRVSNLFRLSGIGDRAIGNVTAASNNFTNNQMDGNSNTAGIASNSAYGNAAANNYAAQGFGNAAGNLFASFGGGATANRVTPGMMQQPFRPNLINTPASINPVF